MPSQIGVMSGNRGNELNADVPVASIADVMAMATSAPATGHFHD